MAEIPFIARAIPSCPLLQKPVPYWPYNRVEYEESAFKAYQQAVKQEIDLYTPHLKGMSFTSLYIGGGTPIVNWPGLVSILDQLKRRLGNINNVCVDLHPGFTVSKMNTVSIT